MATLIWFDGVGAPGGASRIYQVSGPLLAAPPRSPYFLLAPLELGDFAERLYRSEASLADLRGFLGGCEVAEGELTEDLEFVAARHRAPLLPVLDGWGDRSAGGVLSYQRDIDAFLPPDAPPLYVTAEAYASLQREAERFGRTWVCEECGEPEDAAVFLWTRHRAESIQVRLTIENQGGVWTCRLHPFHFPKEGPEP